MMVRTLPENATAEDMGALLEDIEGKQSRRGNQRECNLTPSEEYVVY